MGAFCKPEGTSCHRRVWPRVFWLAVFIVFKVADGLMTYAAVELFGPQARAIPPWPHGWHARQRPALSAPRDGMRMRRDSLRFGVPTVLVG